MNFSDLHFLRAPSYPVDQWSPSFLALGTGFMKDIFSMDGGGGVRDVSGSKQIVEAIM